MIFVTKGSHDVGYTLNMKERWAIRRLSGTVIGGFECCYDKRSQFKIRAKTYLEGQALHKKYWREFQTKYPEFIMDLRRIFLSKIYSETGPKIKKAKDQDL